VASVEYVALDEMLAKRVRGDSQRKRVQAEYDAYVEALAPGQAGKVLLDRGEKMSMVRDRLRSAARRLDRPVQLRRRGGALYFRLREDGPAHEPAGEIVIEEVKVIEEPAATPKVSRKRRSAASPTN